jgi:ADP-heptose:LPS heptosyltransferase
MGCIPEKWHPLQVCYNLPVNGWKEWKSMHQIDALFKFIKTIGIEHFIKDISIEVASDSKEKVRSFFEDNKINNRRNIVIFNISNNKQENTWSIERFLETAKMLFKKYNIALIITSTPEDKDKALKLMNSIGSNVLYFSTPDIMDFAALVAEADLLICGEGGAMHIGAGVHTPTISLWGSRRPVKWMPYGEKQFVVKRGEHVNSIPASDILDVVRENGLLK